MFKNDLDKEVIRNWFILAREGTLGDEAKRILRRAIAKQPSDKLTFSIACAGRKFISPRGEVYNVTIEPYEFGFNAHMVDVIQNYVDEYNTAHIPQNLRRMEYYYNDCAIGTVFITRRYFPNYHGKKW